jgi:hypothetical protein
MIRNTVLAIIAITILSLGLCPLSHCATKYQGIPTCGKGLLVTTWEHVNSFPMSRGDVEDDGSNGDHVCSDSEVIRVCVNHKHQLSIRCN